MEVNLIAEMEIRGKQHRCGTKINLDNPEEASMLAKELLFTMQSIRDMDMIETEGVYPWGKPSIKL